MKKLLAVAGLSLAAVAGLSGCSVNPGAAAVVGDTTITEAEVSDLAEQAAGMVQARGQIVEALVTEAQQEQTGDVLAEEWKAFLDTHAKDMGDEERSEAYEQCSRDDKVDADSPETVRLWCEVNYVLVKNPDLREEAPAASAQDLGLEIVVSPRYKDYFGGESLLPSFVTAQERGA